MKGYFDLGNGQQAEYHYFPSCQNTVCVCRANLSKRNQTSLNARSICPHRSLSLCGGPDILPVVGDIAESFGPGLEQTMYRNNGGREGPEFNKRSPYEFFFEPKEEEEEE